MEHPGDWGNFISDMEDFQESVSISNYGTKNFKAAQGFLKSLPVMQKLPSAALHPAPSLRINKTSVKSKYHAYRYTQDTLDGTLNPVYAAMGWFEYPTKLKIFNGGVLCGLRSKDVLLQLRWACYWA